MIYLDNAATTLQKPPEVAEAVIRAMRSAGNASRGVSAASVEAARIVYGARADLAEFFNCDAPERVIFTSNGTESLNIALNGVFHKGDHVITTDLEHNSVLRPLYRLQENGEIRLSFVPADRRGSIQEEDFERLILPDTRAIVVTHASNLTGDAVDIGRLGQLTKARGLLLIADAAQTAGSFPIDMQTMHIDVLCVTGHKGLFGPQGTGCLCVGDGVDIRPFKAGGSGILSFSKKQPESYPERLEAGTLNAHGIAGLAAGLRFIRAVGRDTIHRHEIHLLRRFLRNIQSIPGLRVYGDFASDSRAPIAALNIGETDSAAVSDELSAEYGIATRSGAHCAPRLHEALGTVVQGAVRFSFSWFNTETEIDAAADALRRIAQ